MNDRTTLPPIELIENPLRIKVIRPGGKFDFRTIKRPSNFDYQKLVKELVEFTNKIREGEDPLAMSVEALRSIEQYFQNDHSTLLSGALHTLMMIRMAANDTLNGSRRTIFHIRPKSRSGRPSGLDIHRGVAILVTAFDILVDAGKSETDAARFLIEKLREFGFVEPSTKKIYTVKKLISIRTKARDGTGPMDVVTHYEDLKRSDQVAENQRAAGAEGAEALATSMAKAVSVHMVS